MAAKLSDLLQLPPDTRVELALALWASLPETARENAMTLTPEAEADLDRRWAEHMKNPASAVPWDDVLTRDSRGA